MMPSPRTRGKGPPDGWRALVQGKQGDVPGRRAAVAALTAVVLGSGCVSLVGPARTADDYDRKASSTAESVASALGVAELHVDAAAHDRLLPPYAARSLSEVEDDAGAAISTFSGIQPPDDRAEELGRDLVEVLGPIEDALAATRVDARRADLDAVAAHAGELADLHEQLDAFIEEQGW
jgi:hypothetical protein